MNVEKKREVSEKSVRSQWEVSEKSVRSQWEVSEKPMRRLISEKPIEMDNELIEHC